VKVSNIQLDSPAELTGIMIDDVLVNVDGSDTEKLSPEEVAVFLRLVCLSI
jgi:C-terminal processing protease CtpA/Prc